MIPEMITSAYLTITTCGTHGNSPSARYISERINYSHNELGRPEFYFSIKKKVLPELEQVLSVASEENWDFYDAKPIRTETYLHAVSFLESLSNALPPPAVGVESDGHITFEWYKSSNRLLSVSVSPVGELHYAALIGPNKSYGTEIFLGETPKVIADLIRRIISL